MKVSAFCFAAGVSIVALAPSCVLAHGAVIRGTVVPGIAVQATYDTGEPMAGAQITVYAPSNPIRPWSTGISDEAGRFSFVPDPRQAGIWAVQARQAGHGAIVHVPVGSAAVEAVAATAPAERLDPLQRALAAGAIVWGFVGTALFFWRRRAGDAYP